MNNKMSSNFSLYFSSDFTLKRQNRAHRIKRKIEMKNLKLYMQNQSIIRENCRLRKKLLLLHQENQTLFSQLQNDNSVSNTRLANINITTSSFQILAYTA